MATAQSGSSKTIQKSLEKAKKENFFLYVKSKDGKLVQTKIYITGREPMWSRIPDLVYSFGTRLAGRNDDIHEFLKVQTSSGDESIDRIYDVFNFEEKNNLLIDKESVNSKRDFPSDYVDFKGDSMRSRTIYDMVAMETSSRAEDRKNTGDTQRREKDELIEPYRLPELLEAHRKATASTSSRSRGSSGIVIHADKVSALIKEIDKDKNLVYSVNRFKPEGTGYRKIQRDRIAKSAVYLGDSYPLSHFVINGSEGKTGGNNFLVLYHVSKGVPLPDARSLAKSEISRLLPGKRGSSPSPARGRSRSPSQNKRSASSSPKKAKPTSKSSSRKPRETKTTDVKTTTGRGDSTTRRATSTTRRSSGSPQSPPPRDLSPSMISRSRINSPPPGKFLNSPSMKPYSKKDACSLPPSPRDSRSMLAKPMMTEIDVSTASRISSSMRNSPTATRTSSPTRDTRGSSDMRPASSPRLRDVSPSRSEMKDSTSPMMGSTSPMGNESRLRATRPPKR